MTFEEFKEWQKAIVQVRNELCKEVVSENLFGIDFNTLIYECQPMVQLTRITEELGLYQLQFKKG